MDESFVGKDPESFAVYKELESVRIEHNVVNWEYSSENVVTNIVGI